MLHIGQCIKEVFDHQPKTHDIEWFASQLNCRRNNIYNIFKRPTIDVELLFQISRILKHDFFRDLTTELTRSENAELDAKQTVFEDIMTAMGKLLKRQLKKVNISGIVPGFQINKWDKEDSLLPPSKYIVSVKTGESEDIRPHVHVYSLEEHFELRFTINEGAFQMLPVKTYGNRPTTDTFEKETDSKLAEYDFWVGGFMYDLDAPDEVYVVSDPKRPWLVTFEFFRWKGTQLGVEPHSFADWAWHDNINMKIGYKHWRELLKK